jgi:hypothetical protein
MQEQGSTIKAPTITRSLTTPSKPPGRLDIPDQCLSLGVPTSKRLYGRVLSEQLLLRRSPLLLEHAPAAQVRLLWGDAFLGATGLSDALDCRVGRTEGRRGKLSALLLNHAYSASCSRRAFDQSLIIGRRSGKHNPRNALPPTGKTQGRHTRSRVVPRFGAVLGFLRRAQNRGVEVYASKGELGFRFARFIQLHFK